MRHAISLEGTVARVVDLEDGDRVLAEGILVPIIRFPIPSDPGVQIQTQVLFSGKSV